MSRQEDQWLGLLFLRLVQTLAVAFSDLAENRMRVSGLLLLASTLALRLPLFAVSEDSAVNMLSEDGFASFFSTVLQYLPVVIVISLHADNLTALQLAIDDFLGLSRLCGKSPLFSRLSSLAGKESSLLSLPSLVHFSLLSQQIIHS